MAKRRRDAFDTPSSSSPPMPPSKRLSLHLADPSTFRSTFPMPRSQWAFSVPHDSPSNPFGLDRSLRALALPRPSGFAKHIVFRMQLVSQIESRPRSRCSAPEAPYRIVQVPLNYSFRLLHELILFLFASDSRLRVRRPRRVFSPRRYPRQPPPLLRKRRSSLEVFGESPKKEDGHLFEVLNDVSISTYRPGIIKPGSGKLYARLSSKRERTLFRSDHPDEEDDEDVFGSTSVKPTAEDDEEEWDWEAEDDFRLSSIWTDGLDLRKGIIYYHTPSTAIHITVCHTRVPSRKGSGNTPFIFSACGGTHGAVRISNIVSGPMPSEEEIKENMEVTPSGLRRGKRKSKPTKETTEGGKTLKALLALTDDDFNEVDDLDDGEDANDNQLERWNAHDAFTHFLAREAARERAMRRTAELEHDVLQSPVPGTHANMLLRASPASGSSTSTSTHMYASRVPQPGCYAQPTASSSSTSLSIAPSSPSTLPVLLPSSDFDGDAEAWSDLDFDTDPNPSSEAEGESSGSSSSLARKHVYELELPMQTPYPANPAVRRRVGRMCKRIERQTSKGLSELSDEDEEAQKDELVSSQESKPEQEDKVPTVEPESEAEVTARQPVVATRGPDLFAEVYGDEPGYESEPEKRLEDEDSDDEGWETGPFEFFVEDDSGDELWPDP